MASALAALPSPGSAEIRPSLKQAQTTPLDTPHITSDHWLEPQPSRLSPFTHSQPCPKHMCTSLSSLPPTLLFLRAKRSKQNVSWFLFAYQTSMRGSPHNADVWIDGDGGLRSKTTVRVYQPWSHARRVPASDRVSPRAIMVAHSPDSRP